MYGYLNTFNPESQLLDTCPVTSELTVGGYVHKSTLCSCSLHNSLTTSMMINTQTMMIDEDALNG